MLNICVIDDEPEICKLISEFVQSWASKHHEMIKTRSYQNPEIFLSDYRDETDIVLLDIQMSPIDGIETAERLRKKGKDVCIVFITSMSEYAIRCYRVRAFSFLTKPLDYVEFDLEFSDAVRSLEEKKENYIMIHSDNAMRKVDIRTISYFEIRGHSIQGHLNNGMSFQSYGSIKNIETQLSDKGFFRCHASYLINLAHIQYIKPAELLMNSGDSIPISKHRRNEFITKMTQFAGERI